MLAHLMAITALTGSLAASLLAQAPGTQAGMAVRGVGAGAIRGVAGDGDRTLTTADADTMADTDTADMDTDAVTPVVITTALTMDTAMAELTDVHL